MGHDTTVDRGVIPLKGPQRALIAKINAMAVPREDGSQGFVLRNKGIILDIVEYLDVCHAIAQAYKLDVLDIVSACPFEVVSPVLQEAPLDDGEDPHPVE